LFLIIEKLISSIVFKRKFILILNGGFVCFGLRQLKFIEKNIYKLTLKYIIILYNYANED